VAHPYRDLLCIRCSMVERAPGPRESLWCDRCAALEIVKLAEQLEQALGGGAELWCRGLVKMGHAAAREAVEHIASAPDEVSQGHLDLRAAYDITGD
jgi:hypothetical protein